MTYRPHKGYYAFTAFNELRKRGRAVKAESTDADVWVAAAKNAEGGAVMIANDTGREVPLKLALSGGKALSCRLTDAKADNRKSDGAPPVLPPHSFCVITCDWQ